MSFVILGNSNKEIAKFLGISHRTVEVHRLRIMQKTGTSNSIELLEYNLAERKLLVNKLNQTEALLKQFLDALPAIAFIKDDKSNLIFCNKFFEETLGIQNWQGMKVESLFTPKVATKMSLDDKRALRSSQLITEENVPNLNGEIRLFQTNKFRIPMDNNISYLGGISLDITERRNAENSLKRTNSLLAAAQEFAHLGSWWWNVTTGENSWSDEQFRIYGYEPNSIIPSHYIFLNMVIVEDRARVQKALEDSLNKKDCFEVEFRIKLPDESIKYILSRGAAYRDSSTLSIVMSGTDLDITKIRVLEKQHLESEARYRYLLEDQTDVICRFKIDGTIIYVNNAYCKMFGKSRENLIGQSWTPLAHHDDISMVNEKLNSISPTNDVVVIENRVYDASGNIRLMQFINRAFFDTDGKINEIQSVGREIK